MREKKEEEREHGKKGGTHLLAPASCGWRSPAAACKTTGGAPLVGLGCGESWEEAARTGALGRSLDLLGRRGGREMRGGEGGRRGRGWEGEDWIGRGTVRE